ncbi:exodeoxyribonuclease VII small subunit [Oribacterium sp. WCC10]|uniref:exodeoxyribonuclease VII small subunit n=1 Tax=Oribacterium sp. WCC10 TaxID=1855343 RepID=UPI0008E37C91|nr:exodeoxyribonuclease VII small subunit [Oribacterium sp. WCC10]SFG21197.1 Exodeoxyribonuclease VII small subunit [Oribacterium sp. WCC10]
MPARAKKTTEETAEENKLPLNEVFKELDDLIVKMEDEDSLEKTFDMYKKGIELLKTANDSIDRIEKQVKVLDDDGILS